MGEGITVECPHRSFKLAKEIKVSGSVMMLVRSFAGM